MTPNLIRYLNKTLFISIPSLFEDGVARPFTLLGADLNGLWLQSAELIDRLLRDEDRELAQLNPAVFVPFAQIAGVLIPTIEPPPQAADESKKKTPPPATARRADKR